MFRRSMADPGENLDEAGFVAVFLVAHDDMRLGMNAFARPVLLLLSEHDLTAREFSDLSGSDARWARSMSARTLSIKALPGADHTFSSREHLDQATELCRDWLAQLTG